MNIYQKVTLFFILLFSATFSAFAQKGEVRGRILDHKNSQPVPFANIIIEGKPSQGTTTDTSGVYILKNVDPGYIRLMVSVIGYEKKTTEDFLVTRSHPVFIDIFLEESEVNLQTVEVRPSLNGKKEESSLSIQSLSIQDIEKSPGAKRGNMLSSDLEMTQIEGNKEKFSGRFTIGSSDIGLTLNGPVTRNSTLIFSVRRSYLQLLFSLLKLPFLPTYNDYQLKYEWNITPKDQLSLISIGSLDNSKLNTGIKNPNETQRYLLGYLPNYFQWSYAIGLVYKHFRAKGNDTFVLSRNMLDNEENKYSNNIENPDSLLLKLKSQKMVPDVLS